MRAGTLGTRHPALGEGPGREITQPGRVELPERLTGGGEMPGRSDPKEAEAGARAQIGARCATAYRLQPSTSRSGSHRWQLSEAAWISGFFFA
jgi:hypothetical protein